MGCDGGGSVAALLRQLDRNTEVETEKAEYDPFEDIHDELLTSADATVIDMASKRRTKQGSYVEDITEGKVVQYIKDLASNPEFLEYLTGKRGLNEDTIKAYEVGYDITRDRYALPVRDENGALVNFRRYLPNAAGHEKMKNAAGHGSPARLYPYATLSSEAIVVCEGEWDALLTNQMGFPAITGTHGVSTWRSQWSKLFKGKHVAIVFDCDKEGRVNARKVARSLSHHAASVRIVDLPLDKDHADLTDYWQEGHSAAEFRALLKAAPKATEDPSEPAAEPESAMVVPVQVVGSMDSSTNGKTLHMQVTITGKKNPTYSVPHRAKLMCTLDAGPKCKLCPMNTEHEGDVTVTIQPKNVGVISKFIDANEAAVTEVLRKHIGAAKCNRFERKELENQSVEEIFVTGSIDTRHNHEEADYTQRRIYNVGNFDTKTNTTATVVGTTFPNPKDRRNEFFAWSLEPAITSIDKFIVNEEVRDRLQVFQPKQGQTPIDKCREIAKDLSDNVTGILGRERLHMCMDLTYHSVLHFPLDGKIISRGWLEFLVVGDTRTGKSETAIHLSHHYGLGHVVGCEGATFAGLVGAVKQVADAWTVHWGEITINDRRLVVLDEASGLSTDIIGQMSDIRSRGVAQLTKAETQQTRARCRMIWISNPRKGKFVDEKKFEGIDIIEDLIGNPEDIARFDFAMSVSMRDVPNEKINSPNRSKVKHVYTEELCRELILWAWSRKPEQVEWKDDAYASVYKLAEWMGKRYVDHPPLIQRTNVREKIARMAVALAARTFSTDASGEYVIVTKAHVEGAVRFLDEIYSYDNFGYKRLSQRITRNRKIARKNRKHIKEWLKENRRLMDFLIDRRGSFRAPDLEEMAHMGRDEVNNCLSKLTEAKMISKSKSQIVMEPELHDLLREIEAET